jgi:UDP-glucose 4-epimerase
MSQALRALVTGSSGRLGRFVVEALQETGWIVTGVDSAAPIDRAPDVLVEGDAADLGFLMATLEGHDSLVHLAAIPDPFRDTAFVTFDTNMRLANAAVCAAAEVGVGRIVLASSQTALGLSYAPQVRSPKYLPVDEAHPCAPEDAYGASKLASEVLFAMAARRDGASVAALRFPVIWDEATFAENTRRRLGDPQQAAKSQWAYVDARDAGRAVALALAAQVAGFAVYNIAADDIFSEENGRDLARQWYLDLDEAALASAVGRQAMFTPAKARDALGFVNRYRWTAAGVIDRKAPAA